MPTNANVPLDVYARPFVPNHLIQVNRDRAAAVFPCASPPWTDFVSYTQSFSGHRFLRDVQPLERPRSGEPAQPGLDGLTSDSYSTFFTTALQHEREAQQVECDDHALYKITLEPAGQRDPRGFIFWLKVPGLREGDLRVEIGDVVKVRPIRFNAQGTILTLGLLHPHQNAYYPEVRPGEVYTGPMQYDTKIWSIDRLRETLSLRIDGLWHDGWFYNACFTVQQSRFDAMQRAVEDAQQLLRQPDSTWMRTMLFPDENDGHLQTTLNSYHVGFVPHDEALNYEQLHAIDSIVKDKYGRIPYIISGPPGTGKTKTTVEVALQLIKQSDSARLLMCAPSDPASDTLVQRLSKHLMPKDLLRLNSPSRGFPETPQTILPYCHVDNAKGIFDLPAFEDLMRKRIIVVTCKDAEMLHGARVTNRDLYYLERSMQAVLHPESQDEPALHWTGLLVDEAAQATEPEVLAALTVVAPPEERPYIHHGSTPAVILVGDHNQLGPRTAWKEPAIQKSLFERLLSRPIYADHPLARSASSGGVVKPLTRSMLPITRPSFANLIKNYRSHPAILSIPSALFYNDTLEPCAENSPGSLSTWPDFMPDMPILFAAITSLDQIEELSGGGWFNHGEACRALDVATSLLRHCTTELHPKDICIMSPFRAQVRCLREMARKMTYPPYGSLGQLNIGPLEAFQGLESRVVILCTTRTRDRFIDQDIARGLGVIHEPRRFNVALTRAKEALIVIGNPEVLREDQSWAAFMAFCTRNGCWHGLPKLPPDLYATLPMTRFEKQLWFRRNVQEEMGEAGAGMRRLGLGGGGNEEQDIWEAGIAAEEAVAQAAEEEQGGEEEHVVEDQEGNEEEHEGHGTEE